MDGEIMSLLKKVIKAILGVKDINYDIPVTYGEFPKYPGSMSSKPYETKTDKYTRLTIIYSGSVKSEYENTLLLNGYNKVNNVRYDKGNAYIIVESFGCNTKIVYHIKR